MKKSILSSPNTLRLLLLINLVVIAAALCLPTTVYADDCLSDPLNAADCMRTGGYRQILVITFATLPTISVIIPNLLQAPTNVLPQILQDKLPPSDQPQQQPVQPQQSGPPPKLVNEKGQVWYQPPWDQGGAYWVDRSEYDSIQQHLQEGYEWSDRWGWKAPEEISQLDQDRDRRWKEFTSKEAGQRRHEQLKRDIQEDLKNDPEYQRIQRELADIKSRLDEMKRQGLKEDIEFYQRQAQHYERQAQYYDNLSKAAGVVKTVADVSIDTLGKAPGPGRAIKYGYHFISKTAQTSIEKGSLTKGLASGAIEAGKSFLGDQEMSKIAEYGVEFTTTTTQKSIEEGSLTKGLQEGLISVGKKGLGDFIKTKIKPETFENVDFKNITHEQIMENKQLQQQLLDEFSQELGVKLNVDQLETILKQVVKN